MSTHLTAIPHRAAASSPLKYDSIHTPPSKEQRALFFFGFFLGYRLSSPPFPLHRSSATGVDALMLIGKLDACPETLPAAQIPALDGGASACELGDDEGSFDECIGTR